MKGDPVYLYYPSSYNTPIISYLFFSSLMFNLAERIKKNAIFFGFCFNIASKGKSNFLSSTMLRESIILLRNTI